MAGLLDPSFGESRQGLLAAPSRAIGGLLDYAYNYSPQTRGMADGVGDLVKSLFSGPSVADRMMSEYRGGQAAMDAAGEDGLARMKALAAHQRSIPIAESVAMDLGGMLGSVKPVGLADTKWLADMLKNAGHSPEIVQSRAYSESHGPSLSQYVKAGDKTIRLSDHDYVPGSSSVDLRYGMDRDYAGYLVAKEFGLPITDDMATAARSQAEKAALKAAEDAKIPENIRYNREALREWQSWNDKLNAAGLMPEDGFASKGARARAINQLREQTRLNR